MTVTEALGDWGHSRHRIHVYRSSWVTKCNTHCLESHHILALAELRHSIWFATGVPLGRTLLGYAENFLDALWCLNRRMCQDSKLASGTDAPVFRLTLAYFK